MLEGLLVGLDGLADGRPIDGCDGLTDGFVIGLSGLAIGCSGFGLSGFGGLGGLGGL